MSASTSLFSEALCLGLNGAGRAGRPPLSPRQLHVLRRMAACGSGRLGVHWRVCEDCGQAEAVAHSCRDRHCPRCQFYKSAQWLERQQRALLGVAYHHVVFTLPHQFNGLIRQNPKRCLSLLFEAASSTLLDFGRRNLEAELGMSAVLHTWGQTMCEHYHLHVVVTGGGLSLSEDEWIEAAPGGRRGRWLFSVRALSEVFRARYLEGLRKFYDKKELVFYDKMASWSRREVFEGELRRAARRRWCVYAKRPFGGPEAVLRYLSLYTHRVAISERRVVEVDREAGSVMFAYKDYRDGGCWKRMRLEAGEFVRRLAQHILPRGFCRIRHYGIVSTRNRSSRVALCRRLLGVEKAPSASPRGAELSGHMGPKPGREPEQAPAGAEATCARCGSARLIWVSLPARAPPPLPAGPGAVDIAMT